MGRSARRGFIKRTREKKVARSARRGHIKTKRGNRTARSVRRGFIKRTWEKKVARRAQSAKERQTCQIVLLLAILKKKKLAKRAIQLVISRPFPLVKMALRRNQFSKLYATPRKAHLTGLERYAHARRARVESYCQLRLALAALRLALEASMRLTASKV